MQQGADLVDDNSKDTALLARLKAQLHKLNIEQRQLADTKGLVNKLKLKPERLV
jgi:hypothetical protein